jgi:alpha-tubulin suppressor-like RCC1 family protein
MKFLLFHLFLTLRFVYFVGDFPTQEKKARSVDNTNAVLLDQLKDLIITKISVAFSNNENSYFFLDHKGEVYSFGCDYRGSLGLLFLI